MTAVAWCSSLLCSCVCGLHGAAEVMPICHRFCAGDSGLHDTSGGDHDMEGDKASQKGQSATASAAEPFEDSATPTVATYDCPVCRKAHVLDLDRLQVQHLTSIFLEVHRPGLGGKASSQEGCSSCCVWALLHARGCLGAPALLCPLSHEGGKRSRGTLSVRLCRWTPTWTASWWICASASGSAARPPAAPPRPTRSPRPSTSP